MEGNGNIRQSFLPSNTKTAQKPFGHCESFIHGHRRDRFKTMDGYDSTGEYYSIYLDLLNWRHNSINPFHGDCRIIPPPRTNEIVVHQYSDEINEIQTDIWSNSGSTASQSSYDSDSESIEQAVVPVVISVSPDKMPPPILMKPDKPRKQKRNVIIN